MLSKKIFLPHTLGKYINQCTKRFNSDIGNAPNTNPRTNVLGPRMCVPTNFDKWLLVWMKKFKSKDEIPNQIRQELLYQTKSRARIKIANYLIGISVIGCFISVYTGKLAARKGESVEKRIAEWHENYKKEVTKGKTES